MANQEHLKILQRSIKAQDRMQEWNQWRKQQPETLPDLSITFLQGAYLAHADLRGVDLNGADLRGADLSYADLRGADLSDINLSGTNLGDTDLSNANLTNALLGYTNLRNANLQGVNFYQAICGYTIFATVDMRGVIGLETVKHNTPSEISISTIYRSQGQIPDIFLRGCGIADDMIGYIHTIAGAIQYYSAFISYNHQDEQFTTRLYNDLQGKGIRCWKYTEDMKIGDDILRHVDRAIRLHDKLLVIFSASSVQSEWVRDEVDAALEREEREGKQILFPIAIDDAIRKTEQPWAARIRRKRNIGDMTHWQDINSYQTAFDRLLRDLKAESNA